MPRMPLKALALEADLSAALGLMVANDVNELPVVQEGICVSGSRPAAAPPRQASGPRGQHAHCSHIHRRPTWPTSWEAP